MANSEIILAIETTASRWSLALTDQNGVLATRVFDVDSIVSRNLVSSVDALLQDVSVQLDDVAKIAVAVGPGSLTGIRLGIAAGLGFAKAAGFQCVGIPLFEAMSMWIDYAADILPAKNLGRGKFVWPAADPTFRSVEAGEVNDLIAAIRRKDANAVLFDVSPDYATQNYLNESGCEVRTTPDNASLLIAAAARINKSGISRELIPIYTNEMNFKMSCPGEHVNG